MSRHSRLIGLVVGIVGVGAALCVGPVRADAADDYCRYDEDVKRWIPPASNPGVNCEEPCHYDGARLVPPAHNPQIKCPATCYYNEATKRFEPPPEGSKSSCSHDTYAWGRHRGYVGTRGPVLDKDGNRTWVTYEPDRMVDTTILVDPEDRSKGVRKAFAPGVPHRIALETDNFENAQVVARDELTLALSQYTTLSAQLPGQVEVVTVDEYRQARDQAGSANVSATRVRTTHVLKTITAFTTPGSDPKLAEFPLDPRTIIPPPLGQPLPLTALIQTVKGAGYGSILYPRPGDRQDGIIAYLSAFFSEKDLDASDELKKLRNRTCQDANGDPSAGDFNYQTGNVWGWDARDDLWAFDGCLANRIGQLWGPMRGAWVDSGSRWMLPHNQHGAMSDQNGRYDLDYPYISNSTFWDTIYVTLNFQPVDPRARFGSRWYIQKRVQGGATLEVNIGELSSYANSFGGKGYGLGVLDGQQSTNLEQWHHVADGNNAAASGLYDTQKWRTVNVGVEVAYMAGKIKYMNEERPGVPLFGRPDLDEVMVKESISPQEDDPPTYLHAPPSPLRSQVPIDLTTNLPAAPDASGPQIDRVQVAQDAAITSDAAPGGQLSPDGTPSPVYDADLVYELGRADFANTDVHVFGPAGELVSSRVGLRQNESPGLVCTPPPDLATNPNAKTTCRVEVSNPPAEGVLTDFIRNRYPGARYKLVVVNRSTGYMGTGYLTLRSDNSNGLVAHEIEGADGSKTITMRPPNITVEVTRVVGEVKGNQCGEDCERLVGFEGAGLTDDTEILIRTVWRDWDGSPLPVDLPGFTGRLSQIVAPATLGGINAGLRNRDRGTGNRGDRVGNFTIRPGTKTQIVRLADPTAHHYYIHVNAANGDRCGSATTGGDPLNSSIAYFTGNSPACTSFANGLADAVDTDIREGYRPARYVPIKVPVFDAAGTQDAVKAAVASAAPGTRVKVAPIYRSVYRAEQQFTVYDLPEFEAPEVVTSYEGGKTNTRLTFGTRLGAGGFDPLDPYGSQKDPTWSLGFDELLAMVDANQAASFDDLETTYAMTPGGQLDGLSAAAAGLTPEDYLALQLYLANDRGNPLYQDFDIPYLLQMDAAPITLTRREILGEFAGEVTLPPYLEGYQLIPLRVLRKAKVTVNAVMASGATLPLVAEGREALEPGIHYFALDGGTLFTLPLEPQFTLRFDAKLEEDPSAPRKSQFASHVVNIQVTRNTERSARPLGEIVEHDVNILDGSLRFSRQDFSLPGLGPELSFQRTYRNVGGGEDFMGPGWSHNLNYRLRPVMFGELGAGSVPSWVEAMRGRIAPATEVERELYPSAERGLSGVEVNGATFLKLSNGTWVGERGRQAKLIQDPGCSVTAPGDCFQYVARDGTRYFFDYPVSQSPVPGTPNTTVNTIPVDQGLAERVEVGHRIRPSGATPAAPGSQPRPVMANRVRDRFENEMELRYSTSDGRLERVKDATNRICTLSYKIEPSVHCDEQKPEFDRLRTITCLDGLVGNINSSDLKLTINFCYDNDGNLAQVSRGDVTQQPKELERYTYVREAGMPGGNFNLESFSDARGSTRTYKYRTGHGPTPSGFDGDHQFALEDMVESIAFPSTRGIDGPIHPTVTFKYELDTRTVTDPRGGTLEKVYRLNQRGNPSRIEEPKGKVTELFWSEDNPNDGCGDGAPPFGHALMKRIVNRGDKLIETRFGYDGDGNLTSECGPGGFTQGWDQFGLLAHRTDFRGIREEWDYDDQGFLREHRQDVGRGNYTTIFTPDLAHKGRVKEERAVGGGQAFPGTTAPADRVTEYEYDTYGNLSAVQIKGAAGSRQATVRDARGRQESSTDRRGAVTTFLYDGYDHVEHVILPPDVDHPVGAHVATQLDFEYDAAGNLRFESDRNGLVFRYAHTQQNQVESITRDADGEGEATRRLTYDALGNLTSETDWADKKTVHTYDDLGFRETTTDRLNAVMTTLHDNLGNVTSSTDFAQLETLYKYDDLNRQTTAEPQCNDPDCVLSRTEYEVSESLSGCVYVNRTTVGGRSSLTGFDGRQQQVRQRDPIGGLYRWDYDQLGQLVRTVDEAGFITTFEYDGRSYLTATLAWGTDLSGPSIVERVQPDQNGNARVVTRFREGENEQTFVRTTTDFDAWNRVRSRTFTGFNVAALSETFKYDGAGNIVEHVDTGNRSRKWLRDRRGQVRQFTDAENHPRLYEEFDANGNPQRVVDARGVATKLVYDDEERLESIEEASNHPVERRTLAITERDGLGNPKKVRDYRGNEHSMDYWSRHQIKSETHPGKPPILYDYGANGQVATITNQRGFVRKFSYDGLDRVHEVFYPNATTLESRTEYDAVGNVDTVENRRGATVDYDYDKFLRVQYVRRYRAGGGSAITVATNAYDDLGNVVSTTDAEGVTTTFAYNNRNQLERTAYGNISTDDPTRTERRTYWESGTLQSVTLPHDTDETPFTTTFEYDNEDRLISQFAAGERTSFTYDENGNLKTLTKPEGQPGGRFAGKLRTFDYDALNRLEYVTDEVNLKSKYVYDKASNVRHVYSPYRNDAWSSAPHTQYDYDPLVDRVTERLQYTTGGARTTAFEEYDAHDNVKALRDPSGRVFHYDYDHNDRLTRSGFPDDAAAIYRPQSVDIDFNDDTNVTTITERKKDPNGVDVVDTTVEEYDLLFDRLVRSTQRGVAVAYDYFNNGNRRSVVTPAGTTSYQYDDQNRLRTATINGADTIYDYHQDGRMRAVDTGNGTVTGYTYYATGRVEDIKHEFQDRSRTFHYSYDKNGNPLSVSDTTTTGGISTGDATTFDDYDAADRLLAFTQDGKQTRYTYERYNRATEKVIGAVDKIYDYEPLSEELRKVTDTIAGTVVNYLPDENGNVKQRETMPSGDRMLFGYNVLDQLGKVTRGPPDAVVGVFDYDSLGRRIREEQTDRVNVTSTYDGIAVLEESVNSLPTRHHFGNGLIASSRGGSDAYVHQDRLGSTANVSGATAGGGDDYKFDPFGVPRSAPAQASSTFSFTAQQRDASTGLYYYGARFYDPAVGRFTSQDTWPGMGGEPQSLNKYLYAYSNPAKFVDPTGHEPCPPGTHRRPRGNPDLVSFQPDDETGDCIPDDKVGGGGISKPKPKPKPKPPAEPPKADPPQTPAQSAEDLPPGYVVTNPDLERWYGRGPRITQAQLDLWNAGRPPQYSTNEDSNGRTADEPGGRVETSGDKAWGFFQGFGMGVYEGAKAAAFIGVASAVIPVAGTVIGAGMLAYGVYNLVADDFAGAKAIGGVISRFADGTATSKDWGVAGAVAGGLVTGKFNKAVQSGAQNGAGAAGGAIRNRLTTAPPRGPPPPAAGVGSASAAPSTPPATSRSLAIQREVTVEANRVGRQIELELRDPLSRMAADPKLARAARLYQDIHALPSPTSRQLNFAKMLRGRLLDRRMQRFMERRYRASGEYPDLRLDQRVPGGGALRPDARFPDAGDGRSLILDFGGPSKAFDLGKYSGLADDVLPVIPESFY